ncbi:MAG: alpha-E domain-containing protein [Rhodocyclaceae bacterium]|nr:alpha-E domain-containing protein [Rhodocyclaceae bacterium]
MLSRTADHCYWMARYTERAENTARMLDVNMRLSLLPQPDDRRRQTWMVPLSISGLADSYFERYKEVTPERVLEFMVFDASNSSSIYSCLRGARENAHAVRGTLTSELWETQNSTWLDMRDYQRERFVEGGIGEFFEWVKFRSHLSRGVTVATMLREEPFNFVRLGTFLERADNTARLLDVKYELLSVSQPDAASDFYQWSFLLRSVSAFEAYRKAYSDQITPRRVAELLILNEKMPRSLCHCMTEVYSNLVAVRNASSAETERRSGELASALRFGNLEDIFELGLHNYLTRFVERVAELSGRIANDFLVPVGSHEVAPVAGKVE